jgi:hypothetical protein|tara:strand:- start:529 stop:729 length:201 start_codon:yes stop_codon:yes gene_type:complete
MHNSKDFINGLYVKDGRLINERPDSESGIAKAGAIKKAMRNSKKVNQIAEGMELAENKKNFRQLRF